MGGDWQQLIQSVLIGLMFSFLLAKLISVITAFKEDNLSLTRSSGASQTQQTQKTDSTSVPESGILDNNSRILKSSSGRSLGDFETASRVSDDNSVLAEVGSTAGADDLSDDTDDDDDWEGVESTELDEAFSAATAFVAASAADRLSHKVPNDVQLQLYGLYKIATEGPCSAPPPPAFKMTARAKWQEWQKMGAMPPEDAMQKYVEIVTEHFPTWASGGTNKNKGRDADAHNSEPNGPMGPVFSTFVHEEESGSELTAVPGNLAHTEMRTMDAVHAFAREGDMGNLLKCIENETSVNLEDSEGRTPLHWAVDRGHLNVIELLTSKKADINAQDNDGQTPLHYAVVCDREAIAEFLVKHNAAVDIKDNDNCSPADLCEKNWPWIRGERLEGKEK